MTVSDEFNVNCNGSVKWEIYKSVMGAIAVAIKIEEYYGEIED